MLFSLLIIINMILCGLVRNFVRLFSFFLITFSFSLVLNYTNKLLVYLWIHTVPLYCRSVSFCCERDFTSSLSHENQTNIIESFCSMSRYLNDLLHIENDNFEQIVDTIYSRGYS